MLGFTYGGPDGATLGGPDGSTLGSPVPRQVTGLTVTDHSADSIDLEWDAAGSADEYAILQAETSGTSTSDYTEIGTTTSTSYTDSSLENGERYYYRVVARNDVGDGEPSSEVNQTTDLPATEITGIDTSVERENTLTLDVQDNSNDGGIDIYRSQDGSLGSVVATDLDPSTTSYTDSSSILDGEEYHYTARRITDHTQADGSQVSTVSYLPDEDQPVLGNGIEDEVAVDRESEVTNNGDVRIQLRETETGTSSWGDSTGFQEFIGAFDTLTMEFVGLEDGEEYEVRARTETDHATGEWTTPVSIVTEFPGATDFKIIETGTDSVTLEWQDNADNEDGTRIYRRENDPKNTFEWSEWEEIDTIGPDGNTGTVTYDDEGLDENTDYEYYVEPYTEHTSIETDTAETRTDYTLVDGVNYVFGEDQNAIHITDDNIIRHNPVKTHTGMGDISASLALAPYLNEFAQRQDRFNIYHNQNPAWTGYLTEVSHDKGGGSTQIRGDGIGKRLEETRPDYDGLGGPVTYENTRLDDAIEDYWGRTPFENYSVTDQETETVAEDDEIQDADSTSEWDDVVSIPDDVPLLINDGELKPAQTAFVTEGEDIFPQTTTSGGGDFVSEDEWSGGEAATVVGDVDDFSYDITLDYTVPAGELVLHARTEEATSDSSALYELFFDGKSLGEEALGQSPFDWEEVITLNPDSDVSPGTYTVEGDIDVSGSFDDPDVRVDVVAVVDNRYVYDFDNSVHEPEGYLDGPQTKPDSVTIETETITTSFNTTAASVDLTIDDTGGSQSIGVSNDGGESYKRTDNTDTLDKSFDGPGREVRAEITLGRYGTRDDQTPRTGYQGQAIDSYSLSVDGDNLIVIVDLELSRNHFDNLKKLHEFGDFFWVIEHDDGDLSNMAVSSFRRGEETREAPDGFNNPKNQQIEVLTGTYYNSIYLEGALREDGTRPSAEVKDDDAIAEDGREISPGVLRDLSITTDAGANFRARALLDAAQSNNDLVGSVTVPPTMTDPGYARPIDFGDGEKDKTVEEVSLSLGTNSAEARFDFSVRSGFAEDITSLRRDAKDQGNQV